MMRRALFLMLTVLTAGFALPLASAEAGCGCNKPPPALALLRPAFASPGDTVTFFPPDNRPGRYEITFGAAPKITADAVYRRDLADSRYKWQVVVTAPALPPGPTVIKGKRGSDSMTLPASAFTMMQPAIALQEGDGETLAKCYSAAVTSDNTVLIPLDISAIDDRMVFNGLGEQYPLLFTAADIAIYNTQGFLMQLLGPQNAGIYAIDDFGNPDSFALTYDRHEFITYREQHAHLNGYGLDAADRTWHVDGSYHVDHDHLVIAIKGVVENQGPPPPGKTPNFDLSIVTMLPEVPGGGVATRTIQWSNACGS